MDLNSLASAANSSGGGDTEYGASGSSSNIPKLMGTPDASGDGVPDIWTVHSTGMVRFYPVSKTALSGSGTEMITPKSYWQTRIAVG